MHCLICIQIIYELDIFVFSSIPTKNRTLIYITSKELPNNPTGLFPSSLTKLQIIIQEETRGILKVSSQVKLHPPTIPSISFQTTYCIASKFLAVHSMHNLLLTSVIPSCSIIPNTYQPP